MKACIRVPQGNIANRMCTYRDGEGFLFKHLTHVIVETWQVQFLLGKTGWLAEDSAKDCNLSPKAVNWNNSFLYDGGYLCSTKALTD